MMMRMMIDDNDGDIKKHIINNTNDNDDNQKAIIESLHLIHYWCVVLDTALKSIKLLKRKEEGQGARRNTGEKERKS